MNISQLIVGVVMILLGLVLIAIMCLKNDVGLKFLIIYAIPLIIIGIFILFNQKEDKIEQINYRRQK